MDFPNRLSLDQAQDLEKVFSKEEIKGAVWDCGLDKSPGPDDYTFGFYRRFWSLIESEVVDVVNHFFHNGFYHKGGNSSFIALIPKTQGAKMVKDFRPISLIAKKKQTMIFKVDFEKAFDSVRWDFLDDVLKNFGFGSRWREWIQSCLKSSRGSILVNGSPTSEFQFFKGLKQGDPLSPFLFILVMESLHLSFQNVVDAGLFKGVALNDSLHISHLFYANDVVFIVKFMTLSLPFYDLGVNIGGHMSRISSWDVVIDKVLKRLSKWKMKVLSVGGRLTLLKSVLGSTPIYYMSMFRAPIHVINKLESIRSHFFNGVDPNVRNTSFIKWDNVLASKEKGGLGVSSFFALNRALIFKWVWRFRSQSNSLWSRVIKALHGEDGKLDQPFKSSFTSNWADIIRSIPSLYNKDGSLSTILEDLILPNMKNRWSWSLLGDGEFSVSSARSSLTLKFLRRLVPKLNSPDGGTFAWLMYPLTKIGGVGSLALRYSPHLEELGRRILIVTSAYNLSLECTYCVVKEDGTVTLPLLVVNYEILVWIHVRNVLIIGMSDDVYFPRNISSSGSHECRTIMNGASTNATLSNDDDKNLEFLLDVFGSKLSADDMASAYMEAGHNLYKACEILYDMLGSSSNNDRPVSIRDLTAAPVSPAGSMGTVGANGAAYARSGTLQNDSTKVTSQSKPKKSGASMGTISGMIGADYGRSRVPTKKTPEITKPVKLMSHEVPASQIWDEKPQLVKEKNESMNKDVEQFLLQMLGDGFKLDMEVIREVVGGCGYDVHQSLEKLMSMSASTLDLGDATASTMEQTNSTDTCENLSKNYEEKLQVNDSAQRSELEKEVLGNLFTVPERCELGPRTILPRLELRTRKYGIVTGPLEDPITVFKTPIVKKEVHGEGNVEIEDNYECLREAAKEHWTTMKQYYRAAAEAYVKGRKDVADKLVNEGHFYMAKAREANEMSAKLLTETRDDGEAISINFNDYDPKEARRLLKTQLKIMSGIPSIHYLKVMVGPNDDKTKPNARKRLITKLLENEKITWAEEQDGQVLSIRIDVINPKRLNGSGNLASNTITDAYGLNS
ncbi:RNA-directed DNA polymerase, eukaryota, reverse transcriptase zinc-binding domain protein [Tanacetum coccineum]